MAWEPWDVADHPISADCAESIHSDKLSWSVQGRRWQRYYHVHVRFRWSWCEKWLVRLRIWLMLGIFFNHSKCFECSCKLAEVVKILADDPDIRLERMCWCIGRCFLWCKILVDVSRRYHPAIAWSAYMAAAYIIEVTLKVSAGPGLFNPSWRMMEMQRQRLFAGTAAMLAQALKLYHHCPDLKWGNVVSDLWGVLRPIKPLTCIISLLAWITQNA